MSDEPCGSVEPNQSAANAAVCELPKGHEGFCEGVARGPAASERPGLYRWLLLRTFTCSQCGMTSAHPQDIEHAYCGNCHQFIRPYSEEAFDE